jgi:putative peptidoglycan lipid II flippase
LDQTHERFQFFRAAGIVSAGVSLSRVTGLVREMAMARLFGAGEVYDAFLLGSRLPNLTRNLFAEGALSAAFVPVFTRVLTAQGKRQAAELSNTVATALLLVAGAVSAAGMIFAPQLVRLLAPGFAQSPEKFALTVLLARIMFPFLVLVALAAQAMGVLNACDIYGPPAVAPVFFNIGSVGIGLALGLAVGHGMIVCMACGVVAGGALQLAWQLPSLWRAGFAYRPRLDWTHPGLRELARMMLPAVVGSAAMQINALVNTRFASLLTGGTGHVIDGPVSWLGYSYRFLQFPLGLFGVAIASATLPAAARAAGRSGEFREIVARSLGMVLLLTIPSSVGLAVLGKSMIGLVYQGGRFDAYDTRQTAAALACYAVGLAGYAATKILAPAFYALHDALTPMWVSLGSVALNFAAAYALVTWTGMGHAGLALASSIVALGGSAALFAMLRARIGGVEGRALASSAVKIAAAAAVMGLVCAASSHAVYAAFPHAARPGKAAQFADLAISVPLGLAVFLAAARWLRVLELRVLRGAFARLASGGFIL